MRQRLRDSKKGWAWAATVALTFLAFLLQALLLKWDITFNAKECAETVVELATIYLVSQGVVDTASKWRGSDFPEDEEIEEGA